MDDSQITPQRVWGLRRPAWTESERIQRHQDNLLLVVTLLIGASVGLVVVAFIVVTERLGSRLYPADGAAWRRLAMPTAGALVSGLLLFRYFPKARGSGIPQTKVAYFLGQGVISLRTVLGKFTCSSISLASGIALGREGPAVHLGAGIASVIGRRLGLGPKRVRSLVPIGTAAALAAAFNTPISAVLFTLEEILGDLHAPVLGSVVISAATSWAVLHLLLGDEPLFHVPAYQLVHPLELGIYALLGVGGGLVSVAFVKLLLAIRRHFAALPVGTQWLQPVAGGLLVGLIGWFVPDVLGVGYAHVGEALNGQMAVELMGLLLALKILATATCYGSGNAGGIFGPSLFIGAMLGGAVGMVAHGLLPDATGSPGAYALVGMGTAFAGIVRAPMTSVIMIFEITRDYSIIVPVMVANLLSFYISRRLQPETVYEALLHQDRVHLPPGRARAEGMPIERVVLPNPETLAADDPVAAHVGRCAASVRGAWPVVDGDRLLGMLSADRLREAVDAGTLDRSLRDLLIASELEADAHVHVDHSTDAALQRMGTTGLTVLPVVSRTNVHTLLGTVALDDIPGAYGPVDDEGQAEERHLEPVSPRRLLTAVLVGVMGLFALAGFLSQRYDAARVRSAEEAYAAGDSLLRAKRDAEAIEQFRAGLSLTHENKHRLGLAIALARTGRDSEAAMYLREVVRTEAGNAIAQLALARIASKADRVDEAIAAYRAAIGGTWPAGAVHDRAEAGFELVDLLQRTGAPRLAIAELLLLADQHAKVPSVLDRIGEAFLGLTSPQQALDVFRQVIDASPRDARAWSGLGEAELTLGDYRAAGRAFEGAVRLDPANTRSSQRLALVTEVLSLDPTQPGLRSRERYARSRILLQTVVASIDACVTATGASVTAEPIALARRALASKRRPSSLTDSAEEYHRLSLELWASRPSGCRAAEHDEALSWVFARHEP